MRILWVTLLVVLLDQLTKVLVVQTMYPGESIPILGDWLKFTYTENPGMAFGINFGPQGTITVLAIVATVLIAWYLYRIRHGYGPYRASLAVILGGALGNIIDRMFYGLLYGYAGFFHGRVVDFIHVDLWRGYLPESIPWIGGSYVALFPIWNVADMAIVVGVAGLLLFQKAFHVHWQQQTSLAATVEASVPGSSIEDK
jgi:signal peptidase II